LRRSIGAGAVLRSGLKLAQSIRGEVARFMAEYSEVPRVVLLQNHGVITLGATPQAVLAAMLMCVKSAEIFAGRTRWEHHSFLLKTTSRAFRGAKMNTIVAKF
jgi:rhamnose utilization protein RhaD (predicted bifunctional aldolase and dehydrogenase)